MSRTFRRYSRVVILGTLILGLMKPPAVEATEFQKLAAINDERNEVISTARSTQTKSVSSASPNDGASFLMIAGQPYTLTARGTFNYAGGRAGYEGDPECSTFNGSVWTDQRFTSSKGTDLIDLKVSDATVVSAFDWTPNVPSATNSACSADHTYRTSFRPATGGWVYFFVHDTDANNVGEIQLTVERGAFSGRRIFEGAPYQCPKRSGEAVKDTGATVGEIEKATTTLDSFTPTIYTVNDKDANGNFIHEWWEQSAHWGLYTCNWAMPDRVYKITISGTWKYDTSRPGEYAMADAECTTGLADPIWFYERYPVAPREVAADYKDNMDVYVNHKNLFWKPNAPDASWWCSTDHTYSALYTPPGPGPIRLHLYDFSYEEWNNAGTLQVTIERVG